MQQAQEEERIKRIIEHCKEWNWCCDCQYRGTLVNGKWTCAAGLNWREIKGREDD